MNSFVSFYPLYLFLSLFRFVVYVMGLSLSIFWNNKESERIWKWAVLASFNLSQVVVLGSEQNHETFQLA
jgi:hypothetical protein